MDFYYFLKKTQKYSKLVVRKFKGYVKGDRDMKNYKKVLCSLMAGLMIVTAAPAAVPEIGTVTEVQAASFGTPKLVSVKAYGKKKVTVKWKNVKGAAGYRVLRKEGNGKWQNVKDVSGAKKTSWSDKKAKTGEKYTYTVRAYKKGKKAFSKYNKKGISVIAGLGTLKLNKAKITVPAGSAYDLNIKGTKLKAKWKSSNSKVAAVSQTGTVTAKKAGKAIITATLGGKKFTCKVTVGKASQSQSQIAQNYIKLKKYIETKGKTDTDGNKVVLETHQEGNDFYVVGFKYFKARDLVNFGVGYKDMAEDVSSTIDVFANCAKDNTVQAQSVLTYQKDSVSTLVNFPASTYTRATNLVFRYENGTKAEKEVQEAANAMMQEGFPIVNNSLKETTGLTLKDLGFTSYK